MKMIWKTNVVHNVDFFEAAKSIPDNSIPIIFTSVPFQEKDVPGPYYEWYDRFMREVERICSDYAIILNSPTRLCEIIRRYPVGKGPVKDGGAGPFRILMWTKGVVQYCYRYQPVIIYRFTKEWNINTKIWTDHLPYSPVREDVNHPYEDPVKLYEAVLRMLPKDKIILDMFAGYGTTPLACRRLERQCIAFEIDPERCSKANQRLETYSQVQLALPKKKYKLIYADPAWKYNNVRTGGSMNSGAAQHYPVMSIRDICDLPIQQICEDDCVLFLWTTVPLLDEGIKVLKSWGFQYKHSLFWRKITSKGMGYWFRGQVEVLLMGVKGKVKAFRSQSTNILQTKVERHSEKPEAMYKLIESLRIEPRIELFARKKRKGWDSWGLDL